MILRLLLRELVAGKTPSAIRIDEADSESSDCESVGEYGHAAGL